MNALPAAEITFDRWGGHLFVGFLPECLHFQYYFQRGQELMASSPDGGAGGNDPFPAPERPSGKLEGKGSESIISEELEPYFHGNRSLEGTVKIRAKVQRKNYRARYQP